jgi:hypothetical protein
VVKYNIKMKLLASIITPIAIHLLALKARPQRVKGLNIWYIDGYNVLGHSGTPKDVASLTEKLQKMQPTTNSVILVLDGKKIRSSQGNSDSAESSTASEDVDASASTATTRIETNGSFQKVLLGDGLLADDYILDEIQLLFQPHATASEDQQRRAQKSIIQVVTADRKLRSEILNIKQPIKVRGVVNPVTFWKRYLPRLCGLKLPKQ